MKKYTLFLFLILFGCKQDKFADKEKIIQPAMTGTDQQKFTRFIPVKFNDNITLTWDLNLHKMKQDSNYYSIKNDKQKLNFLINNISNNESIHVNICSKKDPLKKGDIAFIYLSEIRIIYYFHCLKLQFDFFEGECPYPSALLDYLESNRKEVTEKVRTCIKF